MEYLKTADKPIFSTAMEMQTHSWERRGWDKQKVALKRTLTCRTGSYWEPAA